VGKNGPARVKMPQSGTPNQANGQWLRISGMDTAKQRLRWPATAMVKHRQGGPEEVIPAGFLVAETT